MAATLKPLPGKIQCDGTVLFGPDDLTPDWDNIQEGFDFVAIDGNGEEIAYNSIVSIYDDFYKGWVLKNKNVSDFDYYRTGRKFDMEVIDWKETLSERPKK